MNFVAAFSTALERRHIRAVLRRQQFDSLRDETDLRPTERAVNTLSARLQAVKSRLIRIEEHTLRIDDVSVLAVGIGREAPAELMRIVGQRRSGDTLRARVEILPLTSNYVAQRAADYDRRGFHDVGEVPPPEARAGRSRLEVHRWRRVEGKWMRMGGATVPINK